MSETQSIHVVRDLVRRRFEQMGVSAPVQLTESILVRRDYYCGHRFKAGNCRAEWHLASGQVQFFSGNERVAEMSVGESIDSEQAA